MECTQRLECTQELYSTQNQNERLIPEQIGFLGICGTKHPVIKGPNKIGRDPQTCGIVLNLHSISRQHAVINILSDKNFMLMDLDSANKTKLSGQTLKPYIPHLLQNGDTVQFGEVFGVFRLLKEETELPMTQAIDIPETPIPTKHMSRINAITTIPESPDVSDKDDSFIVPSQLRGQPFSSPKTSNFFKPGKTISIQPVGSNKIDNVYWNSSNKSTSLIMDDSNDSVMHLKSNEENISNDIHDLETQPAFLPQKVHKESTESLYTADTQLPISDIKESLIHTADTQRTAEIPMNIKIKTQPFSEMNSPTIHEEDNQMQSSSPSIHSLDTQIPAGDHLSDICKAVVQQDLGANKENDDSIYNAATQIFPLKKEDISTVANKIDVSLSSTKSNSKANVSNDEIIFDEVDNQSFEDLESQPILFDDIDLPINRLVEPEVDTQSQIIKPKCAKRALRIKSDSSTDCEDIDMLPTQQIIDNKVDNDDGDHKNCEDEMIELNKNYKSTNKICSPKTVECFEDMATQVITVDETTSNASKNVEEFEDMLTQVIAIDEIQTDTTGDKDKTSIDIDFENLPTQVLDQDVPGKIRDHEQLSKFEDSPFKVPLNSPLKSKKKDISKLSNEKPVVTKGKASSSSGDRYYQDTQEIYSDLCTQKIDMTETVQNKMEPTFNVNKKPVIRNIDIHCQENEFIVVQEKGNPIASNSFAQNNNDVVNASTLKRVASDGSTSSDTEITPKKQRAFKFMNTDLPNSQEIKTNVSSVLPIETESSSESESEVNSGDQCTPILFRKKKKIKQVPKLDLSKKFDIETLPSRVITRVRKPTAKLQELKSKKMVENILKPTFVTELGDIDKDIITENITRLKTKIEKMKNTKVSVHAVKETTQTDCNKDTQPQKSNDGIEQTITKKVTRQVESNMKIKQDGSSIEKQDKSSKEVETNINREMKPIDKESSKKIKPVDISDGNIADNVKREHKSRRKPKEKTEKTSTENKKDSNKRKNEDKRTSRHDNTNQSIDKNESKNKSSSTEKNNNVNNNLNLTSENKRSTRSARRAKDKNSTAEASTKQESQNNQTEKPNKRNNTKKQEPKLNKEEENIPEKEVRRSKRQKTVKEKEPVATIKSILKKSLPHEESAVYNLSSGSSSDCSRSNKRPALDDNNVPSPKKTRSMVINNTSLRLTPARMMKTQYVLFTAFPYESVKEKLEKMGAVVVTDVLKCTVLLTGQIKRTFKLLCAIGLGKPIVGPDWVQACADTNMVVDPWLYLIKDEAAEKRFHFNLEQTLTGKRNFLNGSNVSSTPSVMPEGHEMKLIVECSGGVWKEGGKQWICVTCPKDQSLWPALRKRGATLVSTEFILGGVLRQRLDINANKYNVI